MFESLRNAWRVADIRKKILYTLMMILFFRIGSVLPVPFINVTALASATNSSGGGADFFIHLVIWGSHPAWVPQKPVQMHHRQADELTQAGGHGAFAAARGTPDHDPLA